MNPEHIGVIFDCDGTLLDSMDAWGEVEDKLAQRAGVQLTSADKEKITTLTIPEVGVFFHEQFGLGGAASDVVSMIDEIMLDYYHNRAHEIPGALAFVRSLVERGVKVSVASSSPQKYLQAGLACAGFAPYVQWVISVDDVHSSKREPKVYDRARSLMGTPLETTWGFEDSVYALYTLRGAGYRTVGICGCEDASAREELRAAADVMIGSFEGLNAETFIAWNEGR